MKCISCDRRFLAKTKTVLCSCGVLNTVSDEEIWMTVRPALKRPGRRETPRNPPKTVSERFARDFPQLNMNSGCGTCREIMSRLDKSDGSAESLNIIARDIVRNGNSSAIKKLFGESRKDQQSRLLSVLVDRFPGYSFLRDSATIATVHYNPSKYNRLRETFYEWLPPLPQNPVCCELVFDDDEPEIEGSIVVRGTREKNAMWQKESLLNILLDRCTTPYFAWCDHDMIPDSPSWLSEGIALLNDKTPAAQLFDSVRYINLDGSVHFTQSSCTRVGRERGRCNPGGMWVAKTDWLRSVGGFDVSHIVGAGDVAFLRKHREKCTVRPGAISHLWHGSPGNRQHNTRLKILTKHNYRHGKDTRINDDGILEWCSDKPELHADVRAFFEGRREDG